MAKSENVSVVTVTYNAHDCVKETLESVISQTYPHIQYIVIDGNSTDGTIDILKEHSQYIDKLVIEDDKGVYDAMNKAIDLADGEWIIFMNAGDRFYDKESLNTIFVDPVPDNIDLIYGDFIWEGVNGLTTIQSRPLELMWQRISFSHQSLLSRTSLMKKKKFDLSFKIVSDYNFYFSCYMEGHKFLKKDFPVSIFQAGGLSDINFLARTIERWKVVKRYRNDIRFHFFYLKLIYKNYFPKILGHG